MAESGSKVMAIDTYLGNQSKRPSFLHPEPKIRSAIRPAIDSLELRRPPENKTWHATCLILNRHYISPVF